MGVVYQAHDPRLDRHVAIKLLPPNLTQDQLAKQRFLQEAQAASALDHPNICTIHKINETNDGQLYLVMAHYEGETLKEQIARGPLELDAAIDIATQVGEGLAETHKAGIVHRDIKPANLLVTKTGVVKILNFGLAKLAGSEGVTQTGTTVGTVAYMSPEQARGQEVDHRTDIWSLEVVLYEMLPGGQPPFQGGNLMEHVSGETLQAELARKPIPSKRAVEIASEVAEALEEAHKKRVIHRDLKPANVMLTEQGHVKVMDFGLAKRVAVESSDDETTGSLTASYWKNSHSQGGSESWNISLQSSFRSSNVES